MKFGTSKRVVSQADRAVKQMLLCVVSLSRGFTEPSNYSSFDLIFSVLPSRVSVSNMIPHFSDKGYNITSATDYLPDGNNRRWQP